MHALKTFWILAAAVVVGLFTSIGCNRQGNRVLVRVSHTHTETHPDHIGLLAFKKYVEEHLGDKFEIKIFSNAALGANEKVLKEVQKGKIQFLTVSSANMEIYDKIYGVFSIPYLFSSESTYEQFISSPKVIGELGQQASSVGLRPLVAFTAGTRNFYSKNPIRSVTDLNGKRLRIQDGPTNVKLVEAFGVGAVPLPFGEVYNALQQGTIDGAENNELALIDQGHGEICKFYSYDGHQMCPDIFVASEKFFASLTKDEQKVFEQAALEAQKAEFAAWHEAIAKAKEDAAKMGVEFIQVDVNEFRNKIMALHEEILKSTPEIREIYREAAAFDKENSR